MHKALTIRGSSCPLLRCPVALSSPIPLSGKVDVRSLVAYSLLQCVSSSRVSVFGQSGADLVALLCLSVSNPNIFSFFVCSRNPYENAFYVVEIIELILTVNDDKLETRQGPCRRWRVAYLVTLATPTSGSVCAEKRDTKLVARKRGR